MFKFIFVLISILNFSDYAISSTEPSNQSVPVETLKRLKEIYINQSDYFLKERFKAAQSPFDRWRAFPPYYYNLIERIQKQPDLVKLFQKYNKPIGFCVGDAHLENFGYLYLPDNKSSFFTFNDLDDVSNCPLFYDALRLIIGNTLISNKLDYSLWLKSYKEGLEGRSYPLPKFLEKLQAKSINNGETTPDFYKKVIKANKCIDEFSELNSDEIKKLQTHYKNANIIIACKNIKKTGGSAGILRFLIHLSYRTEKNSSQEIFELKQLLNPAPQYLNDNYDRKKDFDYIFKNHWDISYKKYYSLEKIDEALFLKRPLWNGNKEVAIDDLKPKQLLEVMYYEAYYLGTIHSANKKILLELNDREIKIAVDAIRDLWLKEMTEE